MATLDTSTVTLDEFLKRQRIKLSPSVYNLCHEGLMRMKNSIDLAHNLEHIERILALLDTFLNNQPEEKSKLNIETLLLAICWHDTWKATRFPTSVISMFFDQYWDGIGSARLFKKEMQGSSIAVATLEAARYAISRHGRFQPRALRTLESRVLKDLDALDRWSIVRIEPLKERFLKDKSFNPRLVKIAKYYFDHFLAQEKATRYYFAWCRDEFLRRKALFIKEIEDLVAEHGYLINQ